ncbi:hypothetical protein F2Q70_00019964, partial [Brassica cretica]
DVRGGVHSLEQNIKDRQSRGVHSVEQNSSKATEADSADDDEVTNRPPGVKVAKARSKKTMVDGKELSEFQTMWSIKKQDLALKERLSKMKLLDSLIAKQGPLADYEEALKKKLIHDFCVTSERVKEWTNHGLAVLMSSSKAIEADSADDDEVTNRPTGVKAAKTRSKKTMVDRKELSEFQTMWSIKKQDLALEERMSKMKVTSERVKEWKNHGLVVLMCSHSRACCPHV